jgi:hypothetical protein
MEKEKQPSQVLENLLFPKIFQTFRMAIQPSKLIIGFLAVAIICLAGWIMDFSKTVVTRGEGQTELQVYMYEPGQVQQFIEANKEDKDNYAGVFSTLWDFAAARFHRAVGSLVVLDLRGVMANIFEYFRAVKWALRYHLLYCIVFGLIKLAVISIAGGAICRIAALQFAQGEKPGLGEALRFSRKKFLSFFSAPLAPVGIIIFIGVFIYLLGLAGNIPRAGELIIGIFIVLALLAGALIAIILIGTVAGFNLMFPAVAYDGSDCFDAISRSFSYVYSKPWRMGFYTAVAAVYGAICYIFVRFLAFLLLFVPYVVLRIGVFNNNRLARVWARPDFGNLHVWSTATSANWSESLAAFLIYLAVLVVVGLLASFLISFYFSANTVIYSLMRNRVDNTALEEIYTEADESQSVPAVTESEPEKPHPESETQGD